MPAPLLYQMFKSKSNFPLHRAIKAHREDVVFLCIVEFSSQVCLLLLATGLLDVRALFSSITHIIIKLNALLYSECFMDNFTVEACRMTDMKGSYI